MPEVVEFTVKSFSPDTQTDRTPFFLQAMMNRMGVSFHKYGSVHDNFPHNRRGIDNVFLRLEKYQEDGNEEWLIDAANYCLIEFLAPSHGDSHFRATTAEESPGAVNRDGSISHGKG